MTPRARRVGRSGAFTLIEVLVVIAIITLLSALCTAAYRRIRINGWRAGVRAQIQSLELALSTYEASTRSLPRTTKPVIPDVFHDDAPALFAALNNAPTVGLGGGPDAPYTVNAKLGKLLDRRALEPGSMGEDGVARSVELTSPEASLATTPTFQAEHGPRSAQPLVYVDPNGRPFHYREWKDVPDSMKNALVESPVLRSGFGTSQIGGDDPIGGPVPDLPRGRYVIWSDGPNGVNEYGEGDDVASWRAD